MQWAGVIAGALALLGVGVLGIGIDRLMKELPKRKVRKMRLKGELPKQIGYSAVREICGMRDAMNAALDRRPPELWRVRELEASINAVLDAQKIFLHEDRLEVWAEARPGDLFWACKRLQDLGWEVIGFAG